MPRLAAALAALATLTAAATARADDWGTPGLDGAHARFSAERSGVAFSDGRWSAAPLAGGARVLASPGVADGFLVSADLDGTVRALRAADGTPAWQNALRSAVQGTPAVAGGRALVPTVGNKLVALHLADGSVAWMRDTGGMTLSSPTPVGADFVLAGGFPQRSVMRLAGATGEIVWQTPPVLDQLSNTSPAVGAGLVVVGSNGGHYYGFDAATGAPRWDYAADGLVHLAAPLITGGRVYMAGGNDSDRVHAIDAATGAAASGWPITLPTPDPDVAGTRVGRHRAVSSFSAAGGVLVLQTRLDDALDTDGDGLADVTLSRETVLGIDPTSGEIVWQTPLARAQIADANDVPKFYVCPTPAGFAADGGTALVAAASSLAPVVVVLDAASGGERARQTVAGAALASPVLANGRLFTTALDGTVEGLASAINHAPSAPIAAGGGAPMDAAEVTLRWLPAVDPDGELPGYELRIDADGEVLESWQQQIFLGQGVTSTRLTAALTPDVPYTFAVRARDARGALSAWSTPQTFSVHRNPPVTVGGAAATSLAAALAGARPGDIVTLGAGRYTLPDTAHVRGGVLVQGAGAGRTVIDATSLGVGVSFDGTDGASATGLDGVTVAGADTCVRVADDAHGGGSPVRLTHVIVRDCHTVGVDVTASGAAAIVNATFVADGTGVRAAAATSIRNSLLTNNGTALSSNAPQALTARYNDLFDNQTDRVGLGVGAGDLSASVTFADLGGRSLTLLSPQPSTDKGDPADPVGDEPAPNGGRINLGAFGGTVDAEQSALSTSTDGTGRPTGAPGATDPTGEPAPHPDGGCTVAGRPSAGWLATLALAALFVARRRRRGRA
jgi:MYXO-CTERM domain-containing protein